MNTDRLLDAIRLDILYGFAELDIHVPAELQERFAEFPPLFGTVPIPFEAIGETMRGIAREMGLSQKPRPLLISALRAERTGEPGLSSQVLSPQSNPGASPGWRIGEWPLVKG